MSKPDKCPLLLAERATQRAPRNYLVAKFQQTTGELRLRGALAQPRFPFAFLTLIWVVQAGIGDRAFGAARTFFHPPLTPLGETTLGTKEAGRILFAEKNRDPLLDEVCLVDAHAVFGPFFGSPSGPFPHVDFLLLMGNKPSARPSLDAGVSMTEEGKWNNQKQTVVAARMAPKCLLGQRSR